MKNFKIMFFSLSYGICTLTLPQQPLMAMEESAEEEIDIPIIPLNKNEALATVLSSGLCTFASSIAGKESIREIPKNTALESILLDAAKKNKQTVTIIRKGKKITRSIDRLIRSGINLNAQDPGYGNYTALHWAVNNGNFDLVVILINHRASLEVEDLSEETPLLLAVKKYTVHNENRELQENRFKIVNKLLEFSANVNTQDHTGKTPLHYAVINGMFDMVKLLVQNYARLDINDNNGYTPISLAQAIGARVKAIYDFLSDAAQNEQDVPSPMFYKYPQPTVVPKPQFQKPIKIPEHLSKEIIAAEEAKEEDKIAVIRS